MWEICREHHGGECKRFIETAEEVSSDDKALERALKKIGLDRRASRSGDS